MINANAAVTEWVKKFGESLLTANTCIRVSIRYANPTDGTVVLSGRTYIAQNYLEKPSMDSRFTQVFTDQPLAEVIHTAIGKDLTFYGSTWGINDPW